MASDSSRTAGDGSNLGINDGKGNFVGAMGKVEMYQRGISFEEAKKKLLGLLSETGVTMLKNDNDGEVVRLSRSSVGKLMSNDAVNKSMDNGFTRKQHYAVASDIGSLFKESVKLYEYPDSTGNPDVFIHRFAAPLHIRDAVAFITVKESRQHGKRMYSVELIEIKKLVGMLEEAGQESLTHFPGTSFHTSNITKLKAAVKKKSKNFSAPKSA